MAAAASLTMNPLTLGLLLAMTVLVVMVRRGDRPWARLFGLYLWLAVLIVVIRVGFRLVFGGFDADSLLAGLYDGLRLAAIVVAVGAANALADPKRLLACLPSALYEVGTAAVIAVTLMPQLAESVRRVRRAQALRGAPPGRRTDLRRWVIPVLEDALDRSLALAAGMDTRGYGRSGGLDRRRRLVTGTLLIVGLCGLCVALYAWLDASVPRWLGLPMLAVALLLTAGGLLSAGRRVQRTSYRPIRWRLPETLVVASGVCVAVVGWQVARADVAIAYPQTDVLPVLTPLAVAGPLVGLLAAAFAPPAVVGR